MKICFSIAQGKLNFTLFILRNVMNPTYIDAALLMRVRKLLKSDNKIIQIASKPIKQNFLQTNKVLIAL